MIIKFLKANITNDLISGNVGYLEFSKFGIFIMIDACQSSTASI